MADEARELLDQLREEQKDNDARDLLDQLRLEQTEQSPEELEEDEFRGPVEEAIGLGEVALQIGSGALLEPAAGFAGLISRGDINEREAAIQGIRAKAFEPRTPVGKRTSKAVGEAMMVLEGWADRFAEAVSFGNPLVATGVKTTILGAPAALGLMGGVTSKIKVKKKIADIEKVADELGLDLGAEELGQQIVTAAGERIDIPVRGAAVQELQGSLKQARDIERERASAAFEQARGAGTAGIRAQSIREFYLNEQLHFRDRFDVDTMPTVSKRFDDLAELVTIAEEAGQGGLINPAVKLDLISRYRERLVNIRPSKSKAKENLVLDDMKRRLDKFLDDQFNQDMITGDPETLTAWKNARKVWSVYKQNFSENKVIAQLVGKDTTAAQVKDWVLGASSMGAKKEASLVVKKLKKILGEDSPEITALRQEYLFDIIDPLLERQPNFTKFLQNYDRSIKNNFELLDELAPFSRSGLEDLVKVADAAQKTGGALSPKLQIDFDRGIAVLSAGHQIARKGYIVANLRQILRAVREGIFGSSQKQLMYRELLGYDPDIPIISKKSLAYTAIVSEMLSEKLEESPKQGTLQ